MSNINNQTQDLYSIESVQDLDNEAAAIVSGGAFSSGKRVLSSGTLILWNSPNARGNPIGFSRGKKSLGAFNNKASSFQVVGNGDWYAFSGKDYKGFKILLRAGKIGNLPGIFNNNIESAVPVGREF
ncbi:beta/gamma crystallin-related protein [Nostoc sp.]|uniref:beta/gamma crystallin-related protein n=1 Tax=Nostoc sp. TaxID=1180 RepID=UPI002FF671B9